MPQRYSNDSAATRSHACRFSPASHSPISALSATATVPGAGRFVPPPRVKMQVRESSSDAQPPWYRSPGGKGTEGLGHMVPHKQQATPTHSVEPDINTVIDPTPE